MAFRALVLAAVVAAAFALSGCAQSETTPPSAATNGEAATQTERLTIDTRTGEASFNVEIADDEAERNRGLMFRERLPDDRGMLFDFPEPEHASFWMRNTPESLDIIFIGVDGRILNIAANTTPLSDAPVPAAGLTRGVLEIRAGRAAELGIRPGDRVHHRIFPG